MRPRVILAVVVSVILMYGCRDETVSTEKPLVLKLEDSTVVIQGHERLFPEEQTDWANIILAITALVSVAVTGALGVTSYRLSKQISLSGMHQEIYKLQCEVLVETFEVLDEMVDSGFSLRFDNDLSKVLETMREGKERLDALPEFGRRADLFLPSVLHDAILDIFTKMDPIEAYYRSLDFETFDPTLNEDGIPVSLLQIEKQLAPLKDSLRKSVNRAVAVARETLGVDPLASNADLLLSPMRRRKS